MHLTFSKNEIRKILCYICLFIYENMINPSCLIVDASFILKQLNKTLFIYKSLLLNAFEMLISYYFYPI